MEPANLNPPPPPGGDALDALLRQSRSAPVADEGFSARVVGALPARHRLIAGWRPVDWLFVALALGLGLILAPQFDPNSLDHLTNQLGLQADRWTDTLFGSKAVLALAITLGTLAYLSFDEELSREPAP